MHRSSIRWILAFNASCGTCRAISERVVQACDGKLEVLPLAHPKVEAWRRQALGPHAPWKPTLLKVTDEGTQVSAWTGPAMGIWLTHRLGLQSTMRVLAALERLRSGEEEPATKQMDSRVIGRAQFLRLCAGGAVAAGMIMLGKMPAFAAGVNKPEMEAQAWVEANKAHLPQTYDALVAHPMAYRKAIYRVSTPKVRGQFWVEHITRYRAAHPKGSAEQEAILDRFLHLARTDLKSLTKADEQAAIAAFGKDKAYAIFATLGPEPMPKPSQISAALKPSLASTVNENCNCTVGHDWCDSSTCYRGGCDIVGGCGAVWSYDCNGLCY